MNVSTLKRPKTGARIAPVTASLPRVNLLPPEIIEDRRLERAKMGMVAVLLLAVASVGAGYTSQAEGLTSAQTRIDTAKKDGDKLRAEQSRYAGVPGVQAALSARQDELVKAMGREIRWSQVLGELSTSMPPRVWLGTIAASQSTPDGVAPATGGAAAGTAGAAGAPGAAAGLGTVTFTGTAVEINDVAAWLEVLAAQPRYANATLTSARQVEIGTTKVYSFTSTVTLTESAASQRFATKGRMP